MNYTNRIKEIGHSLVRLAVDASFILFDMVNETSSKEIVVATKEDIYDDPESTLCVSVTPSDSDCPVPGYVHAVKKIGGVIKLVVMYSNGDTEAVDTSLDVYEILFLLKKINKGTGNIKSTKTTAK